MRAPGPRVAVLLAALAAPASAAADDLPSDAWRRLEVQVRDGTVARAAAARDFARLVPELERQLTAQACAPSPRASWVFPVAGHGARAIGGSRGSGYQPTGYDWFDGNRHRGHPAHDIFIRDRDRDSRDDRTGAPVTVRSLSGGLVVAVNPEWAPGSPLRGGLYVWVYDPVSAGLFYYAHLARVLVAPGACITAGTPLGEVGRTGRNAAPPRSPTHLHFMTLAIVDGAPRARDVYRDLVRVGRAP